MMTEKLIQHPARGIAASIADLLNLRHAANKINLESLLRTKTVLFGQQNSYLQGRGIDFAEVRHYQLGDDIRHMDWKVTARSGKPHTKVFQEERERPVFVVIDYNESMFFGTRVAYKSVIAAQAASLIAWAAAHQHHRTGGIIFSGKQLIDIPPQAGTRGAMTIIKKLAHVAKPLCTHSTGSLANALKRLRHMAKPGSLIFIFSDFATLDAETKNHLSQLSVYNKLVANFIYDPLEVSLPPADLYAVSNGENIISVDTSVKKLCEKFQDQFARHVEKLSYVMKQRRIPLRNLATDSDVENLWL